MARQNNAVQVFFLSVWAMATLILVFAVVLLVREMARQNLDPLGFMREENAGQTARQARPNPGLPVAERDVALYFASRDARGLVPELRRIELTNSTIENCRTAIEALVAGPTQPLAPVIPGSVQVRALYMLDNGELVVDFSRELQQEHARRNSASLEALLIYALANTLTQNTLAGEEGGPVRRLRLLIEGLPPQVTFPAHIDVSQPIAPDQRWVLPERATPANA